MKSTEQTNSLFQVAEISITYSSTVKPSQRPKVGSSWDAEQVLRGNWEEGTLGHREQVRILLLNRTNKVLGIFLAALTLKFFQQLLKSAQIHLLLVAGKLSFMAFPDYRFLYKMKVFTPII